MKVDDGETAARRSWRGQHEGAPLPVLVVEAGGSTGGGGADARVGAGADGQRRRRLRILQEATKIRMREANVRMQAAKTVGVHNGIQHRHLLDLLERDLVDDRIEIDAVVGMGLRFPPRRLTARARTKVIGRRSCAVHALDEQAQRGSIVPLHAHVIGRLHHSERLRE